MDGWSPFVGQSNDWAFIMLTKSIHETITGMRVYSGPEQHRGGHKYATDSHVLTLPLAYPGQFPERAQHAGERERQKKVVN